MSATDVKCETSEDLEFNDDYEKPLRHGYDLNVIVDLLDLHYNGETVTFPGNRTLQQVGNVGSSAAIQHGVRVSRSQRPPTITIEL